MLRRARLRSATVSEFIAQVQRCARGKAHGEVRTANLRLLALPHKVENQLYAARNAKLVVDAEKVIAHRMLADPQLLADPPVRKPLREQRSNFVLAFREQRPSSIVKRAKRTGLDDGLQEEMELIAVRPNLTSMNRLDTLAKGFKRLRAAKDAFSSSTKSIHDEIATCGL